MAIADVRPHRIWVETGRYPQSDPAQPKRTPRPAQYSRESALDLLRDILAERGLLNARIGLELSFIPAADYPAFTALQASWQDATRLVERLRSIKTSREIEYLRSAAEYARVGLTDLVTAIQPGIDATRMTEIWTKAVRAEAGRREAPAPGSWAYISVAGDGFAPGGPARTGDLIKIDVGCIVSGYSSDGGRTAVIGTPHPDAVRIYDALHRAFDAGFAHLKPGMPLADIYRATANSMWDQGFESYNRGRDCRTQSLGPTWSLPWLGRYRQAACPVSGGQSRHRRRDAVRRRCALHPGAACR